MQKISKKSSAYSDGSSWRTVRRTTCVTSIIALAGDDIVGRKTSRLRSSPRPARLVRVLGRTWSATPAQKQARQAKSAPHSWTVTLTESREWGSRRAGGRRAVSPCVHAGSNDAAFRRLAAQRYSEGQFSRNNAAKNTVRFRGSQPPHWR